MYNTKFVQKLAFAYRNCPFSPETTKHFQAYIISLLFLFSRLRRCRRMHYAFDMSVYACVRMYYVRARAEVIFDQLESTSSLILSFTLLSYFVAPCNSWLTSTFERT